MIVFIGTGMRVCSKGSCLYYVSKNILDLQNIMNSFINLI
jgi:hypothetical protein